MGHDEPLWWQARVVYQVYPRSFQDTDGDGVGDLRGVIERLDYLSDTLGIDAIWLSPFFPSPMRDFGYDIADYTDVDPLFGDLATFDALVAEAHARDIRIIIDYVPNHCSDQHPWFVEARSSRESPKRDWFIWADPKPDGSPPNNWVGPFGGSTWELDGASGQYYLHIFLPEQPDLNWRNPEVRAAMLDVLRFWLARGVDGVRIDALHNVMKDPELRDNPENHADHLLTHRTHGLEFDRQHHLYEFDHDDNHEVARVMRAVLDEFEAERPRVAIGELHIFDLERWSRYYGEGLDELHLPFNFGLLNTPWEAGQVRALVDALEAAIPPGGWPNYVLGNHDEPRIATRIGAAEARVGMMLLLTLRGTPTLYYGDELGIRDAVVPSERMQDPWGIRMGDAQFSRDPARAPMPWDASPNGGFCPAGVEPWLPLAPDAATTNVAAQLADPHSMLNLTRALLRLRRSSRALATGDYRAVDVVPAGVFGYLRESGAERYLIMLSFVPAPTTIDLPEVGPATVAISTALDREGPADLSRLSLRGNEGLVLRLG
ncbi:MAG TPA: alpha-amylase family glycosyl hydrolase [Thermomicrobiales bacterium]|nr:alpha-amylase family glycosyl hydrolase [Thermomicrobiales bacterium]